MLTLAGRWVLLRGCLLLLGSALTAGRGLVGALVLLSGRLLLVRTLTESAPLGLEGWRWGFLLGGAGAACGGLFFLTLPESPRWLAAVGRPEEAWAVWRRFERSALLMPPVRITGAGSDSARRATSG